MHICLDKTPEKIIGRAANTAGAHLYHVEADCSGLPCQNYDERKVLYNHGSSCVQLILLYLIGQSTSVHGMPAIL